MSGLSDVTMSALTSALDGLSARQRATAANVANVQTPYYTATDVDFEDALRQALGTGTDPSTVTPTYTADTSSAKEDGNNVSLNDQMLQMSQDNLRYQTAIQGMNDQFSWLRTAIDPGSS